jgi:hypothetical protein
VRSPVWDEEAPDDDRRPDLARALAILVTVLALAACGGGSSGGNNAPQQSAAGAAPVANGVVPPGSSVYFGSAYDPATFAVADKSSRIKKGSPVVAVGRALAAVDPTGVKVRIESDGQPKPLRPPTTMDNPSSATLFASDLTADALGPGTWIVSYLDSEGRTLASGFLTIIP